MIFSSLMQLKRGRNDTCRSLRLSSVHFQSYKIRNCPRTSILTPNERYKPSSQNQNAFRNVPINLWRRYWKKSLRQFNFNTRVIIMPHKCSTTPICGTAKISCKIRCQVPHEMPNCYAISSCWHMDLNTFIQLQLQCLQLIFSHQHCRDVQIF